MVFYEVFSHSELRRYKTTIFSKASIVQLICIVLTFLSPFLIAYFSGGFWIKEKLHTEQPKISFEYRYLLFIETDSNLYLSSSYDNINQIYSNQFLPALRTVYESDSNDDGINDLLQLSLVLSGIPSTESVRSLKILLLFNNSLSTYSNVKFESIGYIESSNSKSSGEFTFSGELSFFQKMKFIERRTYSDYNFNYLDQNNLYLESLQLNQILQVFYERQYGTRLVTDYVSWTSSTSDGFNINLNIRYPSFNIIFVPAFWEQFKWGWIQYICILIPFLYVFKQIKIFIFENQLVPTIVTQNHKLKTC